MKYVLYILNMYAEKYVYFISIKYLEIYKIHNIYNMYVCAYILYIKYYLHV